ncbi:MAG: putative cytokinetic ring protein SteA [Coriobacteriia bacterium]
MRFEGTARLDKRTKDLVKRLGSGDIAIVDHRDMDRVSAEALAETGVEVVVNAAQSISGVYPNVGPLILARRGVHLVDAVGQGVFERISEGDTIEVAGGDILKDGAVVASGTPLTVAGIEEAMRRAEAGLDQTLDEFARNTMEFLEKERSLISSETVVPPTDVDLSGRHVLVVVRGYDYREDLTTLRPYIREMKPVLVGVDGGADALLEAGFVPDIIVGDMDSVSDDALRCGAELIAHAYPDGRCPARDRLAALGVSHKEWAMMGTSEDLALLLAYESGADLIVAVGTHTNLVEYLDKGRQGMASTFLVRLKVGPRLVDAKGVSKLYRAGPGWVELAGITAAGLTAVAAAIIISSPARNLIALFLLRVRAWLGL